MLSLLGVAARGLAGAGVASGGVGSVLSGLLASPVRADLALDVQILQTASSLEQLLVETYNSVLTANLGGIGTVAGPAAQVLRTFVTITMTQHDEHKRAFQNQTKLLGGQEQTAPHPRFGDVVDRVVPTLRTPFDVVDFASTLENVATDTYLLNLAMLEDTESKALLASVMGVEAQHLAGLRTMSTLLEMNLSELIRIPIGADLARLPPEAVTAAFPDAFESTARADLIADPASGGVR